MKEIKLTEWRWLFYILGWIVCVPNPILLFILFVLYYPPTKESKKKGYLTKTYQKFLYYLGLIAFPFVVMLIVLFFLWTI